MRIPEVRVRLRELAIRHGIPELNTLADHLIRRSSKRKKTRVKSAPVDPIVLAQIRAYALANPKLSHQEIGDKFSVNPGRVSEAINGKRK